MAIIRKESIQMRRDRVTFAMMLGIDPIWICNQQRPETSAGGSGHRQSGPLLAGHDFRAGTDRILPIRSRHEQFRRG